MGRSASGAERGKPWQPASAGSLSKPRSSAVLAKCASAQAALGESEELPDSVIKMLVGMASSCLTSFAEERRSSQAPVVEMIGEARQGIEAGYQKAVAEAKAQLDGIGDMKMLRSR